MAGCARYGEVKDNYFLNLETSFPLSVSTSKNQSLHFQEGLWCLEVDASKGIWEPV